MKPAANPNALPLCLDEQCTNPFHVARRNADPRRTLIEKAARASFDASGPHLHSWEDSPGALRQRYIDDATTHYDVIAGQVRAEERKRAADVVGHRAARFEDANVKTALLLAAVAIEESA